MKALSLLLPLCALGLIAIEAKPVPDGVSSRPNFVVIMVDGVVRAKTTPTRLIKQSH